MLIKFDELDGAIIGMTANYDKIVYSAQRIQTKLVV